MKITVILPVYNGGRHLSESVYSVLNQTLLDFEFLICDDFSRDGSYEWLQSITDSRVKLYRNSVNEGLFPTLNKLINLSSGQLIKLWSQDDIMYSSCLQETLAVHKNYPHISFSCSAVDIIDENGLFLSTASENGESVWELITPEHHLEIALRWGSVCGNIANVTLTKSTLDEIGLFNASMKYCADFDMWERLTKKYSIAKSTHALIKLRRHKGQLSRKPGMALFQLKEDLIIFENLWARTPNDKIEYAKRTFLMYRAQYYLNVMFGELKDFRLIGFIRYAFVLNKKVSIINLIFNRLRINLFSQSF